MKTRISYAFAALGFIGSLSAANAASHSYGLQAGTARAIDVTIQACSFVEWQAGVNYSAGTVVRYPPNGQYYKLVNVGTNGSDGTDPTVSTWYWQPTTCDNTPPPAGGCEGAVNWQAGVNYSAGTIVRYPPNGQYYKLVNVGTNGSDGTDPTVSTWYWQPTTCSGNPPTEPPAGSFPLTEAQFNQFFPNRNSLYTYQGLVQAARSYPAFASEGGATVAKQEMAAFLANIKHESGSLQYVRELNQANWPHYCQPAGTCGNLQYYGRGPIQLSWNYNYNSAGQALGLPLLQQPDLVATNSAITWQTALWYWMTQRGNTSNTPHQAMVNLRHFGETIRAINGGLECNGASPTGTQQMLVRGQYYREFSNSLGVAAVPNQTC